jgi:hypothetical protein
MRAALRAPIPPQSLRWRDQLAFVDILLALDTQMPTNISAFAIADGPRRRLSSA